LESPAAMRRRLRVELRRLRAHASLTQRDVAESLDWSPSKVIRIENGQVGVSVTDLRALAELYNLTDSTVLLELTTMAKNSKRQPFSDYRDVLSAETIRYFGYEASSSLIRQVNPLLVPGLVQTEEYTRGLLKAWLKSDRDIDRIVESRRERQELLEQTDAPKIFMILDEAVLHRAVGGRAVMRRQLDHLLDMNSRPAISIQVLPFTIGAHEGMKGPFVHLEFPDISDPDVVLLENERTTTSFIDDPAVTGPYQVDFYRLEDAAAPATEFGTYIEKARHTLEDNPANNA